MDKNNYMALVLIAVAAEGLEEYDQALKAYKRAIEADEELLLAWQVRFYISESGFPSRGAGIEYVDSVVLQSLEVLIWFDYIAPGNSSLISPQKRIVGH